MRNTFCCRLLFFCIQFSFLLSYQLTAQKSVSAEQDYFYNLEKANWLQKIEFETKTVSDTSIDMKFYHIKLDVSINSPFIKGSVLCLFESKSNQLSEISIDLVQSLGIDSITGNAIGYNHFSDTLNIQLDRFYNYGEEISVLIYYSGVPPVLNSLKGMRYEFHGNSEPVIATLSTPYLAHLWMPCKDGPGDKVDSVYIDISIPDTSINNLDLTAVSNGRLENVAVSDGKKTFMWKERYPIVPYYLMIAISNYCQFQQTVIDSSGNEFPVIYNVFKEDSLTAYQGTLQLPMAIDLFSSLFGSYPFKNEKYGMTQLGFYGAIENQTNTIQNTLNPSWFMVSVHELSHMWFGNMITCSNWHHGWLNEGFATYSEALWMEHTGGFNSYKNYLGYYRFLEGGTVYLENIDDPFNVFVDIIYAKGAWVLHMLRGVLGDDDFFSSISHYASDPRFKYKHASTEDFQNVCETVSGKDLGYFFDQWIYDEYYPIYNATYNYSTRTHKLEIQLTQTQSQNGWRQVFAMPVDVKVNFSSGGDTLITLWNDQQNQDYFISLASQVQSVVIDPDQWILRMIGSVSDINQEELPEITSFSLSNNYPNPFNPGTNIQCTIGSRGFVSLKVYDVLGNELETLVSEDKPAGIYEIELNASSYPAGVYFYRLQAGAYHETKKMLLLK